MNKYLQILLLLALLGFFSQGCNSQDNKTESNRVEKCPYDVKNTLLANPDSSPNKLFTELYTSALVLRQNGELEKANKALTKGICLEPKWAYGYYERGLNYYDLGKTDKAIKNLEKAKSLWKDPDYNRAESDYAIESYLTTIENTLEEIK